MRAFFSLVVLFFFINFISCKTVKYLDVNESKISIDRGYLASYLDSNVFVYRTSTPVFNGNEDSDEPRPFEIKLPKCIRYFEIDHQHDFKFYYDKNEAIFVKLEPREHFDSLSQIGMSYSPSRDEIYDLIKYGEYLKGSKQKYLLQRTPLDVSKNTLILKKPGVTILLYNIRPSKIGAFVRLCNQFTFLKE